MPVVKVVFAIVGVGLLTLAGLGGYLYLQNGKTSILKLNPPVTSSPTPTPLSSPTAISSPPLSAAAVVFEAEGSFTPVEKTELTKKVVNPLVDYYADQEAGYLVSLTIAHNTQESRDNYPYQGKAIFKGGGNSGFLVTKLGTGVDWWFPECMGACPYTDTYRAKYPEVVAKTQ